MRPAERYGGAAGAGLVTPSVPAGLPELMESITREVLRNNPDDIYAFCAQHLEKLLLIRDGKEETKKKPKITLQQRIAQVQQKVRMKADERYKGLIINQSHINIPEDEATVHENVNVGEQHKTVKMEDRENYENVMETNAIDRSSDCTQSTSGALIEKDCDRDDANIKAAETSDLLAVFDQDSEKYKTKLENTVSECLHYDEVKEDDVSASGTFTLHDINAEKETNDATTNQVDRNPESQVEQSNLSPKHKIIEVEKVFLENSNIENPSALSKNDNNISENQSSASMVENFKQTNICNSVKLKSAASNMEENADNDIIVAEEVGKTGTSNENKNKDTNNANTPQEDKTHDVVIYEAQVNNKTIYAEDQNNQIEKCNANKSDEVKPQTTDINNSNNENTLEENVVHKPGNSSESELPTNTIETVDDKPELDFVNSQILKNNLEPILSSPIETDTSNKQVTEINNPENASERELPTNTIETVDDKPELDFVNLQILENNVQPILSSPIETDTSNKQVTEINNPGNASEREPPTNTIETVDDKPELNFVNSQIHKNNVEPILTSPIETDTSNKQVTEINNPGNASEREPPTNTIGTVDDKPALDFLNSQMLKNNVEPIVAIPIDIDTVYKQVTEINNTINNEGNPILVEYSIEDPEKNAAGDDESNKPACSSHDKSVQQSEQELQNSNNDKNNFSHATSMDLETAAITIQKVFRAFLFKNRGSTSEDNTNDGNSIDMSSEASNKTSDTEADLLKMVTNELLNHERCDSDMMTRNNSVLQTVNEEKSLSLSTDESFSSAATVIQAHVRGFLVRNRLNLNKPTSSDTPAVSEDTLEMDTPRVTSGKTVLNINMPDQEHFFSIADSIDASVDLPTDRTIDGGNATNLHPLGYDKDTRKRLTREDAVQSLSPTSNNSFNSPKETSVDIVEEKCLSTSDGPSHDDEIENRDFSDRMQKEIKSTDEEEQRNKQTETTAQPTEEPSERLITHLSSHPTEAVTPICEQSSDMVCDVKQGLLHSSEFHEPVLPTRVIRNDSSIVREFKSALVFFIKWHAASCSS